MHVKIAGGLQSWTQNSIQPALAREQRLVVIRFKVTFLHLKHC